jgi:hypothetical protein
VSKIVNGGSMLSDRQPTALSNGPRRVAAILLVLVPAAIVLSTVAYLAQPPVLPRIPLMECFAQRP